MRDNTTDPEPAIPGKPPPAQAPRDTRGAQRVKVRQLGATTCEQLEDWAATEAPLHVQLDGESWTTTMRTPGADRELVAGLLLAEHLIDSVQDLGSIAPCSRPNRGSIERINIVSAPGRPFPEPAELDGLRSAFMNTSCGVCGKVELDVELGDYAPLATETSFSVAELLDGFAKLKMAQRLFSLSGGTHAAGLLHAEAGLQHVFEDVGRHNAVDKSLGSRLLRNTPRPDLCALLVSGRVSFEIVQKAARAGVSTVAAVSAPTSLAIEVATRLNMTLAGFTRGAGLNIYCGSNIHADSTSAASSLNA